MARYDLYLHNKKNAFSLSLLFGALQNSTNKEATTRCLLCVSVQDLRDAPTPCCVSTTRRRSSTTQERPHRPHTQQAPYSFYCTSAQQNGLRAAEAKQLLRKQGSLLPTNPRRKTRTARAPPTSYVQDTLCKEQRCSTGRTLPRTHPIRTEGINLSSGMHASQPTHTPLVV